MGSALILGEIAEAPDIGDAEPVVQINQIGELRLSPQLAKTLVGIVEDQLMAYEARFGPIPKIEVSSLSAGKLPKAQ